MTLSTAQWGLVLSALTSWSAVSESLEDDESVVAAERDRALAAVIRTQLAEQGWSAA
ncbi:hypothetical protein [Actinomadura coerulea]|uniref:hypothetical protein n=1 Tax=Actinomadura coerulea TaxID=46159 RepID=UPI0034460A41